MYIPLGGWRLCFPSLPGHSMLSAPNGRKACCKPAIIENAKTMKKMNDESILIPGINF